MASSQSLGNIYISINARLNKLRADLRKAEGMTRASGHKMDTALSLKGARKSLMSFNALLVATFAGVGIGSIARFTKSIVSIGTEFEHSMLIVKGVTRATGKQFEDLTKLAMKLGATTEWTAKQSAEGLKFLGMAGLGAERSLKALPGMLDLATAGAIDLGTAADIATNAMTAMQLPVEDLARVNDVFIATITRSNTNMAMMAESFKYAAPLAKAFGMDIETLAALIGVLGNAGIQGSMAGTQLAFAMQKTHKVFEKLNMSGSGKSFVDALKAAKEQGWGATEMMKAFGMRGGRAALVLKDLVPMVEELEAKLRNSEGEAKSLAETMRSSTRNAFIELKSAIENIAIEAFADNAGGLNKALRDLTVTIRDGTGDYVKVGAAFVNIANALIAGANAAIKLYEVSQLLKNQGWLQKWMEGAWDRRIAQLGTGGPDPNEGKLNAQSQYSERERRRLGLAVEDAESKKRGPSYNSRAMPVDMWATRKVTPEFKKDFNKLPEEFLFDLPDIKKYTDTNIPKNRLLKLHKEELESNHKTVMALTDMWATFNDERTKNASEASIAKAAALEEITESSFSVMTELSERTAWAMQENFSSFFFDAMKGELTSLKDLATSIFDSILKAFSDMAGQMATQAIFGKDFKGGMLSTIVSAISGYNTGAPGATTIRGGAGGGYGFDSGGHIGESVRGVGIRSGMSYEFHPNETVIPDKAIGKARGGAVLNNEINLSIFANDAASFADMANRNPGAIIGPIMQGIQDGNMPLINSIRGVV